METRNAERAQRFGKLLRAYDTDNTDACRLTDLLTDARHWCDRNHRSYADHDRVAHEHYSAEVVEECRP